MEEIKEEIVDESYEFGNSDIKNKDLPKLDELEPEEDNDDDDEDEDVVLFIEYKYCTICHIEQPLRCKHCK